MTPFQSKCINACRSILEAELGLPDVIFAETVGKRETYYKFAFRQARYMIEIYIYIDEAGFMIDGHDWRICERPDYSSDEELITAFTSKLKNVIQFFPPS